ncbi:MAG: twin-arginine translocation signal domain-containing protein [Bacteroidales bacterium]|nr:twin-arginine translocation signal domain-containing protein [Bacteroidales bacterium]
MDRRDFIKVSGVAAAGLALTGCAPKAASWSKKEKELFGDRMKGHFTMKQISSATDTIGNSYLFKTTGGKVIVIDGGFASDAENLRANIMEAGGHVDLWFITHPHEDHMEAFVTILNDLREVTIDKLVYSRVPDEYLDLEPGSAANARSYYRAIDNSTAKTDFIDIHIPGQRFDIDGIGIMILGVANPELRMNPYNNQSVIIRLWDDTKSVVILGDAGVECGDKALANFKDYLDCDYMQMAHHGQNGCSEAFYKAIEFRACLWPTPSWVWEPAPEHTHLKTRDTRRWMDEKGITEHHASCVEKDWVLL